MPNSTVPRTCEKYSYLTIRHVEVGIRFRMGADLYQVKVGGQFGLDAEFQIFDNVKVGGLGIVRLPNIEFRILKNVKVGVRFK